MFAFSSPELLSQPFPEEILPNNWPPSLDWPPPTFFHYAGLGSPNQMPFFCSPLRASSLHACFFSCNQELNVIALSRHRPICYFLVPKVPLPPFLDLFGVFRCLPTFLGLWCSFGSKNLIRGANAPCTSVPF